MKAEELTLLALRACPLAFQRTTKRGIVSPPIHSMPVQ